MTGYGDMLKRGRFSITMILFMVIVCKASLWYLD